jgi:hypothetical protein
MKKNILCNQCFFKMKRNKALQLKVIKLLIIFLLIKAISSLVKITKGVRTSTDNSFSYEATSSSEAIVKSRAQHSPGT